ncbi:MAG: hypothetical protein ACJA1R_002398, partial [Flavobacteriales bacterium]
MTLPRSILLASLTLSLSACGGATTRDAGPAEAAALQLVEEASPTPT